MLLYKNWDKVKGGAIALKNTVVESFGQLKQKTLAIFNTLPEPIKTAVALIGTVIKAPLGQIKNAFATAFNVIKAAINGDMDGVKNAINQGLQNALTLAKTAVRNIVSAFKSLGSQLMGAGREAVAGFIKGFTGKMGEALKKARELASQVYNTVKKTLDIRSPSRKMKKLGKHTAEGLAVGIKKGSKKATAEATKMAQQVLKAVNDEIENNKRSLALIGKDELAALQYDLNKSKYKGATAGKKRELLASKQALLTAMQAHDTAEDLAKRTKEIIAEIAKMDEAMQTHGFNRLWLLEYQIAHSDKYKGIDGEILATLKEKTAEQMKFNDALERSNKIANLNKSLDEELLSLNKQIDLYGNNSRADAFDYDKNRGDYDGANADKLALKSDYLRQIELLEHITNLQNAFAKLLPTDSPAEALRRQFDEQMAVINEYQARFLDTEDKANQLRQQKAAAFKTALLDLDLAVYEQRLNAGSQFMASLFGQNSRAYKAMFAMEKGVALARILPANKTALAQAWASMPFPANLANVGKVLLESGALVAAVGTIRPVIGQAHDGIMSVPASGTWNLQKGERVLPRHTAAALDDTLHRLNAKGNTVVNVNVTVNSDGGDGVQASGDLGRHFGEVISAAVRRQLLAERRQGGLLA